MRNSLAIILLNPQMGENIGAAARVMHNFALNDLRLVAPRDGWPNEKAVEMSAGAKNLINNAKIFDNVADALHDVQYAAITTARHRDMNKNVLSPKELHNKIADKNNEKCAIIFGPERSGVTNEDISWANDIVSIEVNPEYSSLNLAQAVAVLCYECSTKSGEMINKTSAKQIATKDELKNFYMHLEESLDESDFFKVADKRLKMTHNIRNIFNRSDLTTQEVNILHGIIKALKK
jgi:tRNA/rRNA methyltransferase